MSVVALSDRAGTDRRRPVSAHERKAPSRGRRMLHVAA